MRQERELTEKRAADERMRIAAQLRQSLLARLETVRSQALIAHAATAPDMRPVGVGGGPVLVASVTGDRVVLPWEWSSANELAHGGAGLVMTKLREAEREEFAHRDPAKAALIIRSALKAAIIPRDAASARLALARVLTKLNRSGEALHAYRELLALRFDVVDEEGVPFAVYAAARLATNDPSRVVTALTERKTLPCCVSPEGLYMLRDALDTTMARRKGTERSAALLGFRTMLDRRIHTAEQMLRFRQDFASLGLRDPRGGTPSLPRWVSYGRAPEAWFVTLADTPSAAAATVVAVDATAILDSVNRLAGANPGGAAGLRLLKADERSNPLFEPEVSGVQVEYVPPLPSAGPVAAFARTLYFGTGILVLGVTLFGAYLLGLDVRRELRLSELRAQFVSSVSHELKTPLTSIRMFAETLLLDRGDDPEHRKEYLETIVGETERLTRLLNNVLDASKIESGQKDYRFESALLAVVIERAARTMQYPLAQLGFHLHVHTEDASVRMEVDQDALQQAVLNLLANAMKYSGDSRDIDLRLTRTGPEAVIEVRDHGIGIAAAHLPRLAEKFFRAPTPENVRIPGTGLGLTLVEHIVAAHRGRLAVSSEVGRGSTFAIHLPLSTG